MIKLCGHRKQSKKEENVGKDEGLDRLDHVATVDRPKLTVGGKGMKFENANFPHPPLGEEVEDIFA